MNPTSLGTQEATSNNVMKEPVISPQMSLDRERLLKELLLLRLAGVSAAGTISSTTQNHPLSLVFVPAVEDASSTSSLIYKDSSSNADSSETRTVLSPLPSMRSTTPTATAASTTTSVTTMDGDDEDEDSFCNNSSNNNNSKKRVLPHHTGGGEGNDNKNINNDKSSVISSDDDEDADDEAVDMSNDNLECRAPPLKKRKIVAVASAKEAANTTNNNINNSTKKQDAGVAEAETDGIIIPRPHDILVGTRVTTTERKNQPGNKSFRSLISQHLDAYQNAKLKKVVVHDILRTIYNENNARFIEKISNVNTNDNNATACTTESGVGVSGGTWMLVTNERRLCNIIVNRFNEQHRIRQSAGLSENAVLVAKGMKSNDHPGNRNLTRLIEENFAEYRSVAKMAGTSAMINDDDEIRRKEIIREVVNAVKTHAGQSGDGQPGFLERRNGEWVSIDDDINRLDDIIESRFNRLLQSNAKALTSINSKRTMSMQQQQFPADSSSDEENDDDDDDNDSAGVNAKKKKKRKTSSNITTNTNNMKEYIFENCVLMSVGKTFNDHPGNRYLRSLIIERINQFKTAPRRKDVTRSVVQMIASRGGCFLERGNNSSNISNDEQEDCWIPINQPYRVERNVESRFYYALQHPETIIQQQQEQNIFENNDSSITKKDRNSSHDINKRQTQLHQQEVVVVKPGSSQPPQRAKPPVTSVVMIPSPLLPITIPLPLPPKQPAQHSRPAALLCLPPPPMVAAIGSSHSITSTTGVATTTASSVTSERKTTKIQQRKGQLDQFNNSYSITNRQDQQQQQQQQQQQLDQRDLEFEVALFLDQMAKRSS